MQGKTLVQVELKHVKSTGGTHVFGNEDAGFKSIYIPKSVFPADFKPEGAVVEMQLSLKSE